MNNTLRDKIFIVSSIIAVTFLHYFTLVSKSGLHDFYRRLYYIPIIWAAFKFKLKGGVAAAVAVVALFAPHILIYFGKINLYIVTQSLEIVMYIIIGSITGALVESETKIRHLLEIQITKLANLENYTTNILDSILNGVIAIDKSLKITSVNKEAKNILNLRKDIFGEFVYQYFDDKEEIKEMLQKSIENNESINEYETFCHKISVKLHMYPLRNILNKLEGMVIVVEDITHIRKLENQIRRTEKLSAIGELASGIAHEIRNPLGIIKTISQTIGKETGDEEIKEGLEIIEHEIDRANKVIQGLLDFAKPNVLNNKFQSIDNIIEDVLVIVNKYSQQHKVEIVYSCNQDSIISADIDKLKQAFINIILNSIQAMPQGGKLYISISSINQFAKISFIDEGIGIQEEKLEKVFEPFYTTKEKGTGLGLSITHRIIEEHKGHIEIESKVGIGTTMNIYLPDNEAGGKAYEESIDS